MAAVTNKIKLSIKAICAHSMKQSMSHCAELTGMNMDFFCLPLPDIGQSITSRHCLAQLIRVWIAN